jgi:streptogramin lyase
MVSNDDAGNHDHAAARRAGERKFDDQFDDDHDQRSSVARRNRNDHLHAQVVVARAKKANRCSGGTLDIGIFAGGAMRRASFGLVLIFVLNLVDCGGASSGNAGGASPVVPTGAPSVGSITFKILIPNAPAPGSAKHRAFVSPSANGALVTAYAHSDASHTTQLGAVATNISSTSTACTTVAGGRTCTVTIVAPAGDDDLVFGLYDAAPVNGAIPQGAHELGIAGVTQTIVAGTTNTVNAPISAIIAGLGAMPQSVDEPADGRSHTVAFVVSPTDFGDNAITAGASNAPYANPIAATVNESGGSGHTLLSLNGGAPASTVTLSKASDTVAAVYDGGGAPGYAATVTLSAPAVNGQGGASESSTITPTLFVTNPTVFYSPTPAQLNTYPEGQHILSISEPTAAAGTTYTVTPTGCSNIASVGTIVGTGTSATLLVVGGVNQSTGGCNIAISDGTLTFNVSVLNTLRSFNAGSTPAITEYDIAATSPIGIVTGADGNLWFTESSNQGISSLKPDGTGYTHYDLASHGFNSPEGDALGPDGNVWFGDALSNLVGKITPSGTISVFSGQTNQGTLAFAAGLDGNIWFSECQGAVGNLNTASGSLTEIPAPNTGEPLGVALGADGAIWFSDGANDQIGRVSGGAASEFPAVTSAQPSFMSAGSDGAMWFAEGGDVSRMDATGALTENNAGGATPQIGFLTAGPDGAVWFADCGNNAIGRITTTPPYTVNEYALPVTIVGPQGITVGPDGNIWFTGNITGNIGVLKL